MHFDYTDKVQDLRARLLEFMDTHVYPNEARFNQEVAENRAKGNAWIPTKLVEELKPKARAAGLWPVCHLPLLGRPSGQCSNWRTYVGRLASLAFVCVG